MTTEALELPITDRLDVLERQVRVFKIGIYLFIILLSFIFSLFANDWMRGTMAGRGVFLKDEHGDVLVSMVAGGGRGNPSLLLSDPAGAARAWLFTTSDGTIQLTLHDGHGQQRCAMIIHNDEAYMAIYDKLGHEIWHAP